MSSTHTYDIRPGDWQKELNQLIHANAHGHARKDKVVSMATIKKRADILFQSFRQLRELGYKLQSVRNLRQRHIEALFKHWENQGLSPSTLQTRHSVLGTFLVWVDKPGTIPPLCDLVSNPESIKRVYRAETDKSWSASSIDPEELLQRIEKEDKRVAIQLELLREFGLRVKEAAMFKPNDSISIDGKSLMLKRGTKGGRIRFVPVETESQRAVLKKAKELAGNGDNHIGIRNKTLKQNLRHFRHVLEKHGVTKAELGVTPHGLRHEYANNRFEELSGGYKTPVRGGVKDEIPADLEKRVRYKVSEELGHSRIYITTAYYGSHRRPVCRTACKSDQVSGVIRTRSCCRCVAETMPVCSLRFSCGDESRQAVPV
ncbi:integrase domain-containing protein [Pseudogulbenkiania sp. MAI-1]|uniref:tyrosine-type recombinase/integrase n=1 Tax=Pseudogulbenkiania sp. MAI-1 TaxID=990370 RepID=UPI0009FF288F